MALWAAGSEGAWSPEPQFTGKSTAIVVSPAQGALVHLQHSYFSQYLDDTICKFKSSPFKAI